MPIEKYELADSQLPAHNLGQTGARVYRKFSNTTNNAIVDSIKDALVAAGWTLTGSTKAEHGIILYGELPWTLPADPPIPDANKELIYETPYRYAAKVQGGLYRFYDPYRQIPATAVYTTWVPMGTSSGASTAALFGALQGQSYYDVTVDTAAWDVDETRPMFRFTAKTGGTTWNAAIHGGQGEVISDARAHYSVTGGASKTGGWIVKSKLQRNSAYLECEMRPTDAGESVGTRFQFTWSASDGAAPKPIFYLTQRGYSGSFPEINYAILANQFQFFVFPADEAAESAAVEYSTSMFASIPYLQAAPVVQNACLLVGENHSWPWRERLKWFGNVYTARDGNMQGPLGVPIGRLKPCTYPLKFPNAPLLTSSGRPLLSNAYVGVPATFSPWSGATVPDNQRETKECRVAGKFWDAILRSQAAKVRDRWIYKGLRWECVASSDGGDGGTEASLWVAYAAQ